MLLTMTLQLPIVKFLTSSNPYFARSRADCIFVFIFVFGVHLAFWYEVFHVLPQYAIETTSSIAVHCTMAVVFYFGALTNLYKVIVIRSDFNLTFDDSSEHNKWPYCNQCSLYKPPRSHHCKICNVCILQRDHHCWFSGCCIGFANHRYYISLLLFMLSATVYANFFHWEFAVGRLGHLGWAFPLCLIAPHVGALLGFLTLYEFLVSVMTFLALFCLLMFIWLLKIQIEQLISGQLRYEHKMKVEDYNYGLLGNLTLIMGQRWYVAWVCPWIPSPLPGDGINFPKAKVKSK